MNNSVPVKHGLRLLADEDLMREVVGGNARAFEILYQRHVVACSGLAMKIVGHPPAAEEVVQEVFLKLWKQPTSFSSEKGRFMNWLFTVVRNCAMDQLRRTRSISSKGAVLSLDIENEASTHFVDMLQDPGPTPYDYVWSEERGRIVGHLLSLLKETQRQAIFMAYFQGLTHQEIAKSLDEPLSTIKTRIRLGRRHLRHLIFSHEVSKELA